MHYRFKPEDLIYNRLKTHPKCEFFIYDRKMWYNKNIKLQGINTTNVDHINREAGEISLYELEVDRPANQLIYPFITKEGSLTSFKTISTTDFNSDFSYGDIITGSYPLSSSISRERFAQGQERLHIVALQNTLNYYTKLSPHYAYNNSRFGNKGDQELSLISIPSIFYGSSIKKGSVSCKFYISGSLVGELQDNRRNGELVQIGPEGSNGSGSIAGVILYTEGFLILTGAWDISNGNHTEPYIPGEAAIAPRWIDFASLGSTGANENLPSSSFNFSFDGTNYIPTVTMFCHAGVGELNHSNNPTYIQRQQDTGSFTAITGSNTYSESDQLTIKNIVKTDYSDPTGSFEKITYISKIGIYDEDKNLIAIAKLYRPLRKREQDSYSIKLKLDF